MLPSGEADELIAALAEVLRQIAYHPHCSYPPDEQAASAMDRQYQIGATDGHRCAAEIARGALDGLVERLREIAR